MVQSVPKKGKKRLIGYFTQETAQRLEQIAKEEERSISYVITKMVEEQLRKKEEEKTNGNN